MALTAATGRSKQGSQAIKLPDQLSVAIYTNDKLFDMIRLKKNTTEGTVLVMSPIQQRTLKAALQHYLDWPEPRLNIPSPYACPGDSADDHAVLNSIARFGNVAKINFGKD